MRKNSTERYRKNKGFTLMEILISLMILSVISISIFAIFSQALNVWSKAASDMKKYSGARAFLDRISLELSCATLDRTDMNFVGQASGATTNGGIKGSEIRFFANITTNSGDSNLCEIGYWLDDNGDIIRYSKNTGLIFGPSFTAFGSITAADCATIAQDINDLEIRYWIADPNGGGSFYDSDSTTWNAATIQYNTLPEAVLIIVTIIDPFTKTPEKFSTVIYLPQAEVF